ncbi:MAG: S8 family peptidase [Gammaproteobacteria bacterium]|nr:S8 family peptidase [Gammaproteobacteria bacterium]
MIASRIKKIGAVGGVLFLGSIKAMVDPATPLMSLDPADYIIPNQFVVISKPSSGKILPTADKTVMSAIQSLSETVGVPVEGAPQPLALPGAVLVTLAPVQGVQVSAQTLDGAFPAGTTVVPVLMAYPAAVEKELIPQNEPLYAHQKWHYEQINAPGAWKHTLGKKDVVVAVLDTGIRPDHPDFKDQLFPGYDFVSDLAKANDGDGRDPDPTDSGDGVSWEDIKNGEAPCKRASKNTWHGTHVAGTIAAALNRIGVVGVAPFVKLLPLRVLARCGGSSVDIMEALLYAAGYPVLGVPTLPSEHKADVINMSLGGISLCQADMQATIKKVIDAGVTVVVAAGNNKINAEKFFPGNCPGVITIAASNLEGELASYSNFGEIVTLTAAGGDKSGGIYSTYNDGEYKPGKSSYGYLKGTSMATPHVAGVVALMLSAIPNKADLSPIQIKDILVRTVSSFPEIQSQQACNKDKCGAGIMDAAAAVEAAIKTVAERPPAPPKP